MIAGLLCIVQLTAQLHSAAEPEMLDLSLRAAKELQSMLNHLLLLGASRENWSSNNRN